MSNDRYTVPFTPMRYDPNSRTSLGIRDMIRRFALVLYLLGIREGHNLLNKDLHDNAGVLELDAYAERIRGRG